MAFFLATVFPLLGTTSAGFVLGLSDYFFNIVELTFTVFIFWIDAFAAPLVDYIFIRFCGVKHWNFS